MDVFGKVTDEILRQLIDVSRYELLDKDEYFPDGPDDVKKWIDEIKREGE